MTLSISILSPPTKILQFAIGILPLYIQQFSCLGCCQKLAIPLIVTIFGPFSGASCLSIMFVFVFVFIFILLLPLFEYSISMVVNRRGHRELNPDLEIRILLCYPLHYAPNLDKAGRGTRSRTEVQGFETPDAIHYTIPPSCFLVNSGCTLYDYKCGNAAQTQISRVNGEDGGSASTKIVY